MMQLFALLLSVLASSLAVAWALLPDDVIGGEWQ